MYIKMKPIHRTIHTHLRSKTQILLKCIFDFEFDMVILLFSHSLSVWMKYKLWSHLFSKDMHTFVSLGISRSGAHENHRFTTCNSQLFEKSTLREVCGDHTITQELCLQALLCTHTLDIVPLVCIETLKTALTSTSICWLPKIRAHCPQQPQDSLQPLHLQSTPIAKHHWLIHYITLTEKLFL